MAIPIMILGESGSGKSASMRELDPRETLLIQSIRKPLPFKSSNWKQYSKDNKSGSIVYTDNWQHIIRAFTLANQLGRDKIVVDDFQYVLANEFMRRATEKGFTKFTEIGHHAWSIFMAAQNLPGNARIYILSHTDTNDQGHTKAKTIGKLLDEKITVEGLFTIVLKSIVSDNTFSFSTQNSGNDTVKSPIGLFDSTLIDNNLSMIDREICEYYELNKPTEAIA